MNISILSFFHITQGNIYRILKYIKFLERAQPDTHPESNLLNKILKSSVVCAIKPQPQSSRIPIPVANKKD